MIPPMWEDYYQSGLALADAMNVANLACSVTRVEGLGHAFPDDFAAAHLPEALAYVLASG